MIRRDSATYNCIVAKQSQFEFGEGVILNVNGSGSLTQAIVHRPVSDKSGETLNCNILHAETCDGELSAYWFTSSPKSHPGIIYTKGIKNNQCERRAETQTHTCFYNLPKNKFTGSDATTQLCAVVSCGNILLGNGAKISIESGVENLSLVYFMSVALVVTSILVVVLSYCALKMRRRECRYCLKPDSQPRSFVAATSVRDQNADNFQYAAVNVRKNNRPSGQRDDNNEQCVNTTCVYSSIRQ
ncbi:uncharacterized protein LOC130130829 [Lampris incognitus]|uniref:uncharacterized protein LOC130130829 n=1 Tax=Lampris incognitus TaxID=2546036 RepID=UPI0024B488ED|nr:uncharacterized protein LOC130130829 [Lampris incognitus]